MGNASPSGKQQDQAGAGRLTVYADFNCPFCYALNERLHLLNLEAATELRMIQHEADVSSRHGGFEVLSKLTSEVAELRRRAASIRINVPMFRPNTAAATALACAIGKSDAAAAGLLRRRIFRAYWIDGEDISRTDVLNRLLQELEIEVPDAGAAIDDMRVWQQSWEQNAEFDRNLPIVINDRGDSVIGFPLEPELDSFLKTGSLVSDELAPGVCEQPERQRILVLDNDAASLRLLLEQMGDTQIEIVEDFSRLVESALNLGMPDLVLVNTTLIGGVESTDWWRDSTDTDLETAVPVIFVADDKSSEAEIAAFEAGAADFIAKPFHPKVLKARLKMHLQARRSQQQLNNIARIDALTSICNRREFDLRLMSEWGRCARAGKSLALLMIDVDKFKEYNDHHGHLRGDDCLVSVAKILQDCMQRSGDLIARYGGEEFVALLPEADFDGALKVAEVCRETVLNARLPHVTSSVSPYVTVSIGIATMLPIYDKSSTLLIEQADIALYQAKQDGRNRVCSFSHED